MMQILFYSKFTLIFNDKIFFVIKKNDLLEIERNVHHCACAYILNVIDFKSGFVFLNYLFKFGFSCPLFHFLNVENTNNLLVVLFASDLAFVSILRIKWNKTYVEDFLVK